jgi:hypothetical protein
MFFGREALLRELMIASQRQHLIVGPRRVGKTSLLKRLEIQLREADPKSHVAFISLLDLREPDAAARELARTIGRDVPKAAGDHSSLVRLLRRWCDENRRKPHVVLFDEVDALLEHDAANGYKLLAALRNLQEQGRCAFIMTGYFHLYKQTMDQRSPLFNFANVKVMGPLERPAALELVTIPMERLGIGYASEQLPSQIADLTGGYPSFLQEVCAAVLEQLKHQGVELNDRDPGQNLLTVFDETLQRAIESNAVWSRFSEIFRMNASLIGRLICYAMVDVDEFTAAEATDRLRGILEPRKAPLHVVEDALLQLKLFAFQAEAETLRWAIPLLRAILRRQDPQQRMKQLTDELPDDPSAWGGRELR